MVAFHSSLGDWPIAVIGHKMRQIAANFKNKSEFIANWLHLL